MARGDSAALSTIEELVWRNDVQYKYAVFANPFAGLSSPNQKYSALKEVQRILGGPDDCLLEGFDISSANESASDSLMKFQQRIREVSPYVGVSIFAGGDGTFNVGMNHSRSPVAGFLPMGTGRALMYELGLSPFVGEAARRIKNGLVRTIDTIICKDGGDDKPSKKALCASVGIDGLFLKERENFQPVKGFPACVLAACKAIPSHKPFYATIDIDGKTFEVPDTLSIIVSKIRWYGYGFKMVPEATSDDGFLHVKVVHSRPLDTAICLFSARFLPSGNPVGEYAPCKRIRIKTANPVLSQADGDLSREPVRVFSYEVRPSDLGIVYAQQKPLKIIPRPVFAYGTT